MAPAAALIPAIAAGLQAVTSIATSFAAAGEGNKLDKRNAQMDETRQAARRALTGAPSPGLGTGGVGTPGLSTQSLATPGLGTGGLMKAQEPTMPKNFFGMNQTQNTNRMGM